MTAAHVPEPTTRTDGLVIRTPRRYDLRMWLDSRGREARFRAEEVGLARIRRGDRVLDVGCGTGSLTITAARVTGSTGRVVGVDPGVEMIERARAKGRHSAQPVEFVATAGEALPFADASFDVVLISLVLHQLPSAPLHATMAEIRRVLAPGGRFLAVDLGTPVPGRKTVHSHNNITPDGGHRFDLERVSLLFEHVGLDIVERGPIAVQYRNLEPLRYVLAELPPAP